MHGLANVFVLVWFGVWGFLVFVLFGGFFAIVFCFLVYNRNQRETMPHLVAKNGGF